jgi:GrpB-like predicted nucleotidyltransferase (UPF0157 family)
MVATMPAPSPDRILIADYNPAWPLLFEDERQRLQPAIGEWTVAIEHVGSTAVPGLAAKPIIDIGVALRSLEDALYCITPLFELGYQCLGEYGIPGRIFFRKLTDSPLPGQTHNSGVGRTHQIHMYESTHEQFAGHIDLRDYLRAHPDAAGEYEQLKRLLARENANIDDYAAAKSDFVRDVLARARGSRSTA